MQKIHSAVPMKLAVFVAKLAGIISGPFARNLALLFIGLKLTGYINWHWFFVTLPIWAGPALVMVPLALIALENGAKKSIAKGEIEKKDGTK